MLLNLAFLFFWPILQGTPVYTELSKFWNNAETIETGLTHPLAAIVCPASDTTSAGWLIAADSSGKMVELRFDGTRWSVVRTFSAGAPLTSLCMGATYKNMEFHLYAGAKSGQVIELSRATMGWSKRDIAQLPGPIKAIHASEAGEGGVISKLFAVDGNGRVTYLGPSAKERDSGSPTQRISWTTQLLPEIPGGASQLASHAYGRRLWLVAAGPKGMIYRYDQDSLGQWYGDSWAKMEAGVRSLAPSADPSLRDAAAFYTGTDGLFRYVFSGHLDDQKARVPAADGVTHLIGVGSQRRFNEFFGVHGDQFCMYEFDFEDKAWHEVPFGKIDPPVVSTEFGFGRHEISAQMYVMCANGKIYEFVRYK